MNEITLAVGNDYRRLNNNEAELSRNGVAKHHKWRLYVEVLSANNNADKHIESVTFKLHPSFSPQSYVKYTPPYQTIQTSYGFFTATIIIKFYHNPTIEIKHDISFNKGGASNIFTVDGGRKPDLHDVTIPTLIDNNGTVKDLTYGIELELSLASHLNLTEDELATAISNAGIDCRFRGYTHETTNYWKIVTDASLVCNRSDQNCLKVELVSPILRGRNGLDQICCIIGVLNNLQINLNTSMAYHLHIGTDQFSLAQLKRICANFLKYEDAFDLMIPISRRADNNKFARSNMHSFGNASNQDINNVVLSRYKLNGLLAVMNKGYDRYYKLNLQRLKNNSATMEFRQHSATTNYNKIGAWILLMLKFVCGSISSDPDNFKQDRSHEYKFQRLFQWIIKDKILLDYYTARKQKLHTNEHYWNCSCGRSFKNSHALLQHKNALNHNSPSCCSDCANH